MERQQPKWAPFRHFHTRCVAVSRAHLRHFLSIIPEDATRSHAFLHRTILFSEFHSIILPINVYFVLLKTQEAKHQHIRTINALHLRSAMFCPSGRVPFPLSNSGFLGNDGRQKTPSSYAIFGSHNPGETTFFFFITFTPDPSLILLMRETAWSRMPLLASFIRFYFSVRVSRSWRFATCNSSQCKFR